MRLLSEDNDWTWMQDRELECTITNMNARAWNANARSRTLMHERETRMLDLAFAFHTRAFMFVILHSRSTFVHSSSWSCIRVPRSCIRAHVAWAYTVGPVQTVKSHPTSRVSSRTALHLTTSLNRPEHRGQSLPNLTDHFPLIGLQANLRPKARNLICCHGRLMSSVLHVLCLVGQ